MSAKSAFLSTNTSVDALWQIPRGIPFPPWCSAPPWHWNRLKNESLSVLWENRLNTGALWPKCLSFVWLTVKSCRTLYFFWSSVWSLSISEAESVIHHILIELLWKGQITCLNKFHFFIQWRIVNHYFIMKLFSAGRSLMMNLAFQTSGSCCKVQAECEVI